MRQNMLSGTGKSVNLTSVKLYGKTGTSQDYRDAWFVGFSDYYVTSVWLGNDNNEPMNKVSGSSYPAIIWRYVMLTAHDEKNHATFKENVKNSDDGFIEKIMRIFN